jgi:hypothetical protein
MKKLWSPLMGLEESGTLPDEKTVDARRGMQKNPQRFFAAFSPACPEIGYSSFA